MKTQSPAGPRLPILANRFAVLGFATLGVAAGVIAGFVAVAPALRWWRGEESNSGEDRSALPVAIEQSGVPRGAAASHGIRTLRGHQKNVGAVALSSKGQCLVSADLGGEIRVWDFHAGVLLSRIDAADMALRRAILSPDGRTVVACGNDASIRLWKAGTGEFVRELQEHSGGVTAVSWIPQTRRIVSSSLDASLILWDVETGEVERRFGTAPDAQTAAPQSLEDLATLRGHFTWIRNVQALPDGRRAISAGNDAVLFVWDLSTGNLVDRLVGHRTVVMGLALSPDGRYVASVGSDRELIVWEVDAAKVVQRWQHPQEKLPVIAFTPDSAMLAVSWDDGVVHFVDARSAVEQNQYEIAESTISSLAIHPDWEIICGCADGLIRIRPIETEP